MQHYIKGERFSGDISESIEVAIQDYDICANQLQLYATQKTHCFVNVFKGAARNFVFDHFEANMSYLVLVAMMKAEYDSDSHQFQIYHELESLRLSSFMRRKEITDDSVGLPEVVDKINHLTPKCPPNFCKEENKTRFLRNAVRDAPWAFTPISQLPTMKFSFNDFVT